MKTQPLKGMRDLLPREQALRDYIQGQILDTYRAAGFQRISTPILEDMENLDKSDGGDNLNLIFKVLKRGEKLAAALRAAYDVTVLPQAKKLGKQFGTLEAAGYNAVAFADNDDIKALGQKAE